MRRFCICCALLTLCLVVFTFTHAHGQDQLRIATYNIKFLDADKLGSQGDREDKIEDVLDLLDADIIALQEVDDRKALERVFRKQDWHLIIDDDSGNTQDVALAVRKPRAVFGFSGSQLNADDEHFLFPSSSDNTFFPNRRDLLCVGVGVGADTLWVMVHHAKSRFETDPDEGRATNDFRREGASVAIVQVVEQRFDERMFVILGDFNDNPDDRSLNILETGDPNAMGGEENDAGAFMINITEELLLSDHVSHGRNSLDIDGDLIDTIDPGSRQRNNDGRGTNDNTGDILFDQILIPADMIEHYVQGSVAVFNREVGVRGNGTNRASDHLPVFADFAFGPDDEPEPPGLAVKIVALLPNPEGTDAGNETITLENTGSAAATLDGWRFMDRAGNEFSLAGSIAGGAQRVIVLTVNSMPLNNTGDEISLISADGVEVDRVSYSKSQVVTGVPISF